jgi:V8-like Glu-specific endopeptidase
MRWSWSSIALPERSTPMPDPEILDVAPYPFHDASARELHMVLCQLYPTGKAAGIVAKNAGVPVHFVNTDQAPYLVWAEVLEQAANAGVTRDLVGLAVQDFPRSPHRPLLAALLANSKPPLPGEPRADDGAPAFREGDDTVTEPEALLFHDDLSLPTGRLASLIATLQRLQALAPAVCKLEVNCAKGIAFGTGFRIGPDLLLSNWHVLSPLGEAATAVTATFGYEDDGQGGGLAGTAIGCDVASIKSDKADDWGVVRVNEPLAAAIPTLSLEQTAVAKVDDGAFIIQHPGGHRKRVAFARNRVTHVSDRVVQYLTDTQVGSSGSPVLDEHGRLISLHHAGGRPQEVAGQVPLRKNEGIRIDRVAAGIQQAGIAL